MMAESQSIIPNHHIMLDNIFRNSFSYDEGEEKLPSTVSINC